MRRLYNLWNRRGSMGRVAGSRIGKLRLISQKVARSDLKTPIDVVRFMTAMQAQDFHSAKWAIGSRCPGSTHRAVEQALASGEIVRSWPMRGTLHFSAAEDLHWILSLTSTRIVNAAKSRHEAAGLTKTVIERARQAMLRALENGARLTRAEMHDVFRRAKIDPEKDRGYMLLWLLSQSGDLCFGPPVGTSQTFVLASHWIKKRRQLDRDEALGELVLRYFRSHGPATLHDFATWSSLTLADAKTGLAVAHTKLAEIAIDERAYFLDPIMLDAKLTKTDGTYALAAFEEFLLGYRDRDAVMSKEKMKEIVPGANGIFAPIIVSNGMVVGTWKRVIEKNAISVTTYPFEPLGSKASAEFTKAIRAYGKFFDAPISMKTGSIKTSQ